MKKKLVAVLACRNTGSRLFGKPLQNLDVKRKYTIIDNLINCLKSFKFIDDICLGISFGNANKIFIDYAKKKKLKYILGDEIDVLSRLIKGGKKCKASDILRVTSECPFLFYEKLILAWKLHKKNNNDFTTIDNVIDGIGFEIINLKALEFSHKNGKKKHRSEFCTLFIRENLKFFKCENLSVNKKFYRKDLRLTVDNPEDLILCRELYKRFKNQAPKIRIDNIIQYLDENKKLIKLTQKFTELSR
jgi:spore coat polysaccharide biosynthesis protein SpsF